MATSCPSQFTCDCSPPSGYAESETSSPAVGSLVHQRDSNGTEAGIIDREDLNRSAANSCLSDEIGTVPIEMVNPAVSPRIKEFHNFAGLRIPPGNVWTFVLIAVQAGQSKILKVGFSAVLSGDDVVGVKGTHIPGCRDMTNTHSVDRPSPIPSGSVPDSRTGSGEQGLEPGFP